MSLNNLIVSCATFVRDHIIAPPFCAYCKKFLYARALFCNECDAKIIPIVSQQLPVWGPYSLQVVAVTDYQEPVRSLIIAKSFGDIVAAHQLGQLVWEKTYIRELPCDYLIPVPLHWIRLTQRGYNQAEEIARVIAAHKKVPLIPLVQRVRWTPFQSSVAVDQRMQNVKNAFTLADYDPTLFKDKHLVIVDDLLTTGATAQAVARTLVSLKPASIRCLVVCRVL